MSYFSVEFKSYFQIFNIINQFHTLKHYSHNRYHGKIVKMVNNNHVQHFINNLNL